MQLINVTAVFVVEIITCGIKVKDLKVTIAHEKKVKKKSKAENHLRIVYFHAISEKGTGFYQVQVLADLYSNVLLKQSCVVCPPSSYHSVLIQQQQHPL